MTMICLLGAGGKMGMRLSRNFAKSDLDVRYVEIKEENRIRLMQEFGVTCEADDSLVSQADTVIMAVPDFCLGDVSENVVPRMKPGSVVIVLDPAVAFAKRLAVREDVTIFVSHPTHPPIINDETTPEGKSDFFGGIHARQSIVNCLYAGDESKYAEAESIAKVMYGPIIRSHRVTVEQFVMLEPALVETLSSTLLVTVREAMDYLIEQGMDEVCVRDFLMGHLYIQVAVIFNYLDISFSDAANKAIELAKSQLLRDDWKTVFEKENVTKTVNQIIKA